MYDANLVHQGYMTGLRGQDPNPLLERTSDYQTGWLHGTEDRAAGVQDRFQEAPGGLGKGSLVLIPKGTVVKTTHHGSQTAGRSYRVRIHDVRNVVPAHIGYDGQMTRPEPARVIWAGTGGYWSTADVLDLGCVVALDKLSDQLAIGDIFQQDGGTTRYSLTRKLRCKTDLVFWARGPQDHMVGQGLEIRGRLVGCTVVEGSAVVTVQWEPGLEQRLVRIYHRRTDGAV